ncbi:MAG: prolyl oligopeptidase family serine peptidase [Nitrospira sp.]|nr:prolyl oligopeptidase family serine peptidase [Nitrospira sp.]
MADLGKDRSIIRNFVWLAGLYSFAPSNPDLQDLFGPPANYPNMQVTTFIDGTQPPMLLLHGEDDTRGKLLNLEKLKQHIEEQGGGVRTIIYPGVGHSGILAALSWLNPSSAPVVEDIVQFFAPVRDKCPIALTESSVPQASAPPAMPGVVSPVNNTMVGLWFQVVRGKDDAQPPLRTDSFGEGVKRAIGRSPSAPCLPKDGTPPPLFRPAACRAAYGVLAQRKP